MIEMIRKYPLDTVPNAEQKVVVRAGSEVLHVGVQKGRPFVWVAEKISETGTETLEFLIMGTGFEFEGRDNYRFLGTLLLREDTLVLHIFLKKQAAND